MIVNTTVLCRRRLGWSARALRVAGFGLCLLASSGLVWAGDDLTITSFTPTHGRAGTSVTINGTNFSATKSNDAVHFGSASATVASATTTQIVTVVPTDAVTGHITVDVSGKSVVSAGNFAVIP